MRRQGRQSVNPWKGRPIGVQPVPAENVEPMVDELVDLFDDLADEHETGLRSTTDRLEAILEIAGAIPRRLSLARAEQRLELARRAAGRKS